MHGVLVECTTSIGFVPTLKSQLYADKNFNLLNKNNAICVSGAFIANFCQFYNTSMYNVYANICTCTCNTCIYMYKM